MTKREKKIEFERNDGLRIPWDGQKKDQLSDESWAGTAGHSDVDSNPRIQFSGEGGIDPKSSVQVSHDGQWSKAFQNHKQEKWKVFLRLQNQSKVITVEISKIAT